MLRRVSPLFLVSLCVFSGCADNGAPVLPVTTPQAAIQHVVVIFGENVSFDHYFATYPNAANLSGETSFKATAGTPVPENLAKANLLTVNPNLANAGNGAGAANPYRLLPAEARTADQDHNYADEQAAFNAGAMDLFPKSVGAKDSAALATATGAQALSQTTALTMGYYDGNTVTALWNYAQNYAMNDHSFGTNFGPSTPGAINLISGQTNGVINSLNPGTAVVADGNGGSTLIGDADPANDVCSSTSKYVGMAGKNVGDLLTAAGKTWGWFQGGFDLTLTNANGTTGCKRSSLSNTPSPTTAADYVPHHEPFQYYATTANPTHARPSAIAAIGQTDAANHQYDIHDFTDALAAGVLPNVSFLKAPAIQNAHAANSTPLDEQQFVVGIVNALQASKFWANTAVVLAYDDSDGWYDHLSMPVNGSATAQDKWNGTGVCISTSASLAALPGVDGNPHAQGRCGYGPRLPLMVLSPWARHNFVDATVTDQTSVLRLIEDVFLSGQRIGQGSFDSLAGTLYNMFDFSTNTAGNAKPVLLDPTTGVVTSK